MLHVCLLVRCFPVTGPSLVRLLVWLLVRLSLVHCWSVTGLLLVCSGHGRWSWSLIVHRSCIARASLVCLFLFLLVCCSSVTDLSARVIVTGPSVVCRSFTPRPSDRPSLLCLFVRRLSGTSPSLVRVVDPSLVFLLESSLSYRCLVASPLGSTGHCVRFGSAVQFYTPRGTAVRFYTPRGTVPFDSPCAHSYSICCVWPPRCSHTLCPTRGVPSLCYHSLVVPQL